MRAVLGIIAGLIAGLVAAVIAGVVAIGATFSLPPGIDPTNGDQVGMVFAAMSSTTQIALAIVWLLTAFAAALVAKLVSRSAAAAWIAALIYAVYFGFDAFLLPLHLPVGIAGLWVVAPLIGGLIGNQLVRGASAPAAAATDDAGEAPADL
jgi:hypothetical protein